MPATIVQVNISPGGLPKRPVAEGFIAPLGVAGDRQAHPEVHGGPRQAVLLVAAETVEALAARGYPVTFGSLGENLTTRGLALGDLRLGDRLRVGGALLEITQVRGPCTQLDIYGPSIKAEIYDPLARAGNPSSPRWGMSGFYASVLEPGAVRPGDIIAVVPHTV